MATSSWQTENQTSKVKASTNTGWTKKTKPYANAISGPNKPKIAKCAPYQNWNWEKIITLTSPDKMNHTGNAGILNPYYNGTQYRIHILSMDQDQAATTRTSTQSNPDPIWTQLRRIQNLNKQQKSRPRRKTCRNKSNNLQEQNR